MGSDQPNHRTADERGGTGSHSSALVLLAVDDEWVSRSLESLLKPRGYLTIKAVTGAEAVELAAKVSPDFVVVDVRLDDGHGIDVIHALGATAAIHAATPVVLMSTSPLPRAQRLAALAAGAWDVLRHPLDAGELILRMETFVAAKRAADRLRDSALADPETGFYNVRGLLQRTREARAEAVRSRRPLVCLVFGPESLEGPRAGDGPEASEHLRDIVRGVAAALQSVTRVSDAVATLGAGEFAIVASDTDEDGGLRLADRVFESIRMARAEAVPTAAARDEFRLRAGLYAPNTNEDVGPADLLLRATMALRRAQSDEGSFRVRFFQA